ncbi:2Fe-2S iron-sulfur cluster binding domain-containing protein, partial [archaeon]|nr:2Fe-2S iron-sulfur cluster binding domain-containing protein [archaeon]
MTIKKQKVSFHPSGLEGVVEEGKTIMAAAGEAAVEIESLCGGKQKCGKCRVIVEEGRENLSPPGESEKKFLTSGEIDAGCRLACAARIEGPVSVSIPEESMPGEMVILEGGGEFAIKVLPDPSEGYGMAFDIGTTTVVGYLMDLKSGEVVATGSIINPQVYFGEDVMSRIAYAAKNADGLETLNKIIIDALNKIIKKAASKAGINQGDISKVTAVGNTAMHHLFLGLDPKPLGVFPFSPVVLEGVDVEAEKLGLDVGALANVHVLPNVAGFVGADNVGVLIASEPYKMPGATLTIDVGTNG